MGRPWKDTEEGNKELLQKRYPTTTLYTIIRTQTGLVLMPVFRGDRPATNLLDHGTASIVKVYTVRFAWRMTLTFCVY